MTILDTVRPTTDTGRTWPAACVMPAVAESVPVLRHFACRVVRRWGLPDHVDEAVALVVTELVSNAVRHSGSPDVALLLASDGATLTVQVKDKGRWRPRPTACDRAETTDDIACGGRGLRLVEEYAAAWAVWRTSVGTRVVAQLALFEASVALVPTARK